MPGSSLVSVRDHREAIIARLCDHFGYDDLDVDEFERRLTRAHQATSIAELDALVDGLPDRQPRTAAREHAALVPAAEVRDRQTIGAIMGGVERHGHWTCPRRLRVIAMMGGAELDFREARLGAGVTEVDVTAFMGGVNVIVPPDLAVETSGFAFMGGVAHLERAPAAPDPERPVLRIHGTAVMGGVSVVTRLPGETAWGAWQRDREERRDQRRQLRDERRQRRRELRAARRDEP
jgi:hypothetical protein